MKQPIQTTVASQSITQSRGSKGTLSTCNQCLWLRIHECMGNGAYPGSNHEQYGTEDGAQQVPQTLAIQLHGHGYQQRAEHEQGLHTQHSEL